MATNDAESSKFLGFAAEAVPDNAANSSKFLGFNPLAPSQTAADASKLLGFDPLAPSQNAGCVAKVVAYAILQTTTAYSLACDAGLYSLAGKTAVLSWGAVLSAEHGSYLLTGFSASFFAPHNYYLLADPGFYRVTTIPAKFKKGKAWTKVDCGPSRWVPVKKSCRK